VDGHFTVKKRFPSPVYFDLCDQPEFAANVANYRKSAGAPFSLGKGAFADITWVGQGTLTWDNKVSGVNGDLLNIFRFRIQTKDTDNGNNDIEFRTPVIVKGRYKIWVSWRTPSSKASTTTKIFFDGVPTSRIINGLEYPNDPSSTTTGIVDKVYESQGYKRYIFPYVKNDNFTCRLVGIVEVTTTGRHLIKFHTDVPSSGGGGDADRFDMVEFRPVEMDQIWPKFLKGIKTGKPSGNDLNGDGLIQRSEADRGDNSNAGY
jgi:hypothetical protein